MEYTRGGYLTGAGIIEEVHNGRIQISNFDEKKVNPNSYNLHICGDNIKRLKPNTEVWTETYGLREYHEWIDVAKPIEYEDMGPIEQIILEPNELYLIPTVEIVSSDYYIPLITGRSSCGRMGLQVHREAGFGDIGFCGRWTLQISVVKPMKLYSNMELAQVYFAVPAGSTEIKYHGKYQNSMSAEGSKINIDFNKK